MKRTKVDTKTKTIPVIVSKETLNIRAPYTVPALSPQPITYLHDGKRHPLTVKVSTAKVRRKK